MKSPLLESSYCRLTLNCCKKSIGIIGPENPSSFGSQIFIALEHSFRNIVTALSKKQERKQENHCRGDRPNPNPEWYSVCSVPKFVLLRVKKQQICGHLLPAMPLSSALFWQNSFQSEFPVFDGIKRTACGNSECKKLPVTYCLYHAGFPSGKQGAVEVQVWTNGSGDKDIRNTAS